MNGATETLPRHDVEILRGLAERKRVLAHDPVNEERRRAWHALDAGRGDRVMVLAEHGGIRDRDKPFPDGRLECADAWARGIENELRTEIFRFEDLQDDYVIEPVMNVNWRITRDDFGVPVVMHYGGSETQMGSRSWEAPIRDLEKDFHRLRPRAASVDREATHRVKARMERLFDGILPVRIRGSFYWTLGMTWHAIELVGLQEFMMAMYDHPEGLHRLMAFLRDDHLAHADWLEREGLYSLNNENDYIGSGSMGYAADLPSRPRQAGEPVRTGDLWALLESQETVGVGPDQFEEFIFPYQAEIAKRFGKIYYGCCEPVHNRWHVLQRIPNVARVSVSPWADQDFMAEALGRERVFSRKPNPTSISTGRFDEAAIRADIRQTLEAARGCRLEIIMKDVHTLNNEPHRLARWVRLAREEIERFG